MSSAEQPGEKADLSLPRRRGRPSFFLLLAVGIYLALYLRFYLASPSGRFPLLDGAENMELARQIAQGTLPAGPFYRAMLYPLMLALFLRGGLPADWLPLIAALIGAALHIGSTWCVGQLARRAWASRRAGLVAAALFGFNPVTIYFAAETLDTTLGLFLFLAGLNVLHAQLAGRSLGGAGSKAPRRAAGVALGTGLWVLAMLARPHYAIVLAGLPLVLSALLWRARQALIWALAGFAAAAGLGLGAAGLVEKLRCGQFHVMPTQGAYSLWAGNRPGANGRYYEQKLHLPAGSVPGGENPARIESELLYRRETGDTGLLDVNRVNAYWKSKTVAAIRAEPLPWLGLMARKVYYLFNNFEQYNNKTYAVQKGLSPMLRLNPLGWGVTLVFCMTGLAWAGLTRRRCAGAGLGLASAGLYAAGAVIFFVSDRFRLPLLPFLCVGAGVWGCAVVKGVGALGGRRALVLVVTALVAGLLTFSRGWGVYDLTPALQDYVLLSIAAGKAGEDGEGLRWARRALQEKADHPDALACAVTRFYNSKLQGGTPEQEFPDETWERQAERAARIPQPVPGVRLVQAVALWKSGRAQEARSMLHSLLEPTTSSSRQGAACTTSDDALGVLLLSGLAEPGDEARARARANDTASLYLLAALGRRETAAPLLPAARRETAAQADQIARRLFP